MKDKSRLNRTLGMICNAALFVILVMALFVYFRIIEISPEAISAWALITSVLCMLSFKFSNKISSFGPTAVVLLYTLCTQFGMVTVRFLLGEEYLSHYKTWTIRFLESDNITIAIAMGMIAVIVYTLTSVLVSMKACPISERKPPVLKYGEYENKYVVYAGYIMLIVSFLYLFAFFAMGKISIQSTYGDFTRNVRSGNAMYSHILIIYATGIAYVIAAGNRKQIRIGIILYSLTAVLMLITGNKGEVFYATLACIGAWQYRGNKINVKLFLFVALTVFFIIPVVSSLRKVGIVDSLNEAKGSSTNSFTEMGMQIRLSVYTITEMQKGTRQLLWGYSYISPFVNIVDTLLFRVGIRLPVPESYNFSSHFIGQGFTQVAEAYCNFGLLGVIGFYALMGGILTRIETRETLMPPLKLACFTSIITILINATRNRFAFVPGQSFVMLVLAWFIRMLLNSKRRRPKNGHT